jgi:hypothetical protein
MNIKLVHRYVALPCLAIAVLATSPGCHRSQAQPVAAAASSAPAPTKKLAKIVFVGKEHACDCTRKSVDSGWAALQKALGTPAKIPTERIQVDTEAAKVEPYRTQKAIMALPAIYFVGAQDAVLDMLQGEVTEAQIQPILASLSGAGNPK